MDIQQSLYDFDATLKATPDITDEQLLEKFPEFGGDLDKLQAAHDYSATLNSGKYETPDEFNHKFPEFFPVKKKDGGDVSENTASDPSLSQLPSESDKTGDPFLAIFKKKQDALAKKEALKASAIPAGPGAVPVQPDYTGVDKEIADTDAAIQKKAKELGLQNFNVDDFQKDFGNLKATDLTDDQLKSLLSVKKDKPLTYARSVANLKWKDAIKSAINKEEDPEKRSQALADFGQMITSGSNITYGNGAYAEMLKNAQENIAAIYRLTAGDSDARESALENFKKDLSPALGRALISDPSANKPGVDVASQVSTDFKSLFDAHYAEQTEELKNATFTDQNAINARQFRLKDVEDAGISIISSGMAQYVEDKSQAFSAYKAFADENVPKLNALSKDIAALKDVPTPEKSQFEQLFKLYNRELNSYNEQRKDLTENGGSRSDFSALNVSAVTLNNINKRLVTLSQQVISPELKAKIDEFNQIASGFDQYSGIAGQQDLLKQWSNYIDNKENTQFQRYPATKLDLITQLEQDWTGPSTNSAERFILNVAGFAEKGGDLLEIMYDKLFSSHQDQVEHDWARVGRDKQTGTRLLYETNDLSLRQHPFVTVFSDEVKKKLSAIDNNPELSDEEKYKQRYPIIVSGLEDGSIYRTTNPNAGDYNLSAKSVLNTISTVAPQILTQLGFTWATGGLGAASTARTMYGLFASTFLQGYSSYHDQAVEMGIANPDEYAMTHSLIDAGTELIGMEDLNAFKSVFKDSKGFAAEFFKKLTPEKVDELMKGSKNVFKDLGGAIKHSLKSNIEEGGEEILSAIGGNIADKNLFNQNANVFDGASDAFVSTVIGQIPMTAVGIPMAYHKTNIGGKYQMYIVGQDPTYMKNVVNDQLNNNEISNVEAAKRIQVIDNMAKAVKEMPKTYQSGKPMRDEDKVKYAWNSMVINTAKSGLSLLPSDQQEKIKETISDAESENSSILSSDGKIAGPLAGNRLFNAPNPETAVIAEKYRQQSGITADPGAKIEKLDTEFSKKIADAYEAMQHNPNDPEVKAAYNALADETMTQFNTIADSGYAFEIYEGQGEPYKNSEEMIKDLKDNKHLYILSTENDFGQNKITDQQREENPLLKESGMFDKNGKPLLVNDIFRGVHDFFGHSERGNSFGAVGEENAWDIHARMYSPLARRAMTTETRGQNSWVNFGKHLRNDQGNIPQPGEAGYKKATERPFAEQKIGLLPEEFSNIDRETPDRSEDPVINKMAKALNSLGVKVKVIQSDAEMASITGQRGVGGLFIANDGTILLNKKSLERAKNEARIVFHEGAHPVMNIIRNTNRELYDKIQAGLEEASGSNKQIANSLAWANRNYEGKEVISDEALVETIAKIADGSLDLNTIPTGLKQSIIDFINKIADIFGLPKVSDTNIAEFKKIAGQVAEALRTGSDVADIVGQENVGKFQNELAQTRIEAKEVLSDENRGNKKVTEVADAFEKAVDDILDPNSDPNSRISRFLKNAYEDLKYFFSEYSGDTGLDWYTNKVKEFNLKLEDASDIAIKNGEMKEENSLRIKDNMDLFKVVLALSSIGVNPRENVKAAFAIWKTFDQATMTFSKYQPGMVSLRTNIEDGKGGYFAPSGEIVKETKNTLDIKQKNGKIITIKKSDLATEFDVTYTNSKGVEVTKSLRLVKKGAVNTVFRSGPSVIKIKNTDIADMTETSDGIQGKGWTTKGNIVALNLNRVENLLADKGNVKDAIDWMNKPQPINDLRKYNPGVPDVNGTKGKLNPIGERYGSYIIGEKLGSFHQNVAGTPTELTMDLWWSRTWNRYMGTLLSTDKKGETIIQETPRTDTERNIMRQAAKTAADSLGLEVHELQAALWYLEQQMYKRMGAAVESYSFVDGINEILLQYGKTTEQIRPQEYGVDSSEADQRRSDAAARAANILYGEGGEGSKGTAPGNSQARKEGDLISDAGLTKEMTEDGKGNYIFFHYSAKEFSKNNPNKFGSNNATGRDENPGIGMTMYYTRPDRIERNVPSDYGYATAIPKNKVYPFNSDPLNLLPLAEKEFRKQYGKDAAFDSNKQIGFVTKAAAAKGFPMTVAEWNIGKTKALRAQTTQSLPATKFTQIKPGTLNQTEITNKEIASLKPNAKNQARVEERVAPNGKPSNLDEKQYAQVRTPEFKAWFGDWENDPENASKVVDENGEPLVVYHGTSADFEVFKYGEFGFHFGTKEQADFVVSRSRILGWKNKVMGLFLNLRNPVEMQDRAKWQGSNVSRSLAKEGVIDKSDYRKDGDFHPDEVKQTLTDKYGIDGIKYQNKVEGKGQSFIAFYPNQIKSATDNSGVFSTTDNNIQARVDDLWHGSPHAFDEFSTKKIGSGEGAQAFGWGLYFTELKDIAKGYANKLTNYQPDATIKDNPLAWLFIEEGRWEEYKEMGYKFWDAVKEINESSKSEVKRHQANLNDVDISIANAKSAWQDEQDHAKQQLKFVEETIAKNKDAKVNEFLNKILEERKQAIEWKMKEPNWEAMKEESIRYNKAYLGAAQEEYESTQFILDNKDHYKKERNLYQVTVNKNKTPEQYEFLRWDKPVPGAMINKIKDQAEKEGLFVSHLQSADDFRIIDTPSWAKRSENDKYSISMDGKTTIGGGYPTLEEAEKIKASLMKQYEIYGNELYRNIARALKSDKEASLFLTRAGIDGVKYPAESMGRSNDQARGYNYVVFDENAVSVENRFQYRKDDTEEEKDRWFAKNVLNRNPETVAKLSKNATKYFAISNKQTAEEVNKFMEGEDPEDVMDYLLGQPTDIPARVRIWMTGAVMDKIDEKIANWKGQDNDAAVERLTTKQAQLIEQIAPLGTELGQAVQAFVRFYENAAGSPGMLNYYTNKILAQVEKEKGSKLTDEEKEQITELAKKASEAPTGHPKDEALFNMANYVSSIIPVKATDIIEAIWYAHILSGITTQSNNFFANFWNTFAEGFVTGIRESIKNGNPMPFLMGLKGFIGGIKEGAIEGKDILMTGITAQDASKFKQNNLLEYFTWKQTKVGKLLNGKVGTILDYSGGLSPKLLKYVGRALSATDAAFSRANAEAFSRMTAYSQALAESKKTPGLDVNQRMNQILNKTPFYVTGAINQALSEGYKKGTTAFKRRVYELQVKGRDANLNKSAEVYGSKVTLNYEPEGFMKPVYNLALAMQKTTKVTKMFLPFTRIIVNLTENSLNYAGAGYWKAIRGTTDSEGGRRKLTKDERIDYAIKSTIGLGTFLMLAAKTGDKDDDWFDITANGTGNPQKNYELVQGGWRPYSIKLKNGHYVSYKDWPIMPVLAAIGAMHDHDKYIKEKQPTNEAIVAIAGAVNSMWDKSVMKGLQDMMEVLSPKQAYNEMSTMGSRLISWGADQVKSVAVSNFTTQIIKMIQEANDSPIKAAKGVDRIYRDIPYLNDGLNPVLNVFGEPVKPSTSERLLPITIGKVATDEILKTFNDLGVFIGKPKSVDIMIDDDGNTRPMTDQEYYEYTKRAGQATKRLLIENWEDIQEALKDTKNKKERQQAAQTAISNIVEAARAEALEPFYEN